MSLTSVTAIISAISPIVSPFLSNIGAEKRSYLSRLANQGSPGVKDQFAGNKTDYTGRNNIIIIVLIVAITLLLTVIAFR